VQELMDRQRAPAQTRRPSRMLEVLEPTQDPGWGLSHEGYNVLSESALEGAGLARPAYAYAYQPVFGRLWPA
jgi:hypothetical protein